MSLRVRTECLWGGILEEDFPKIPEDEDATMGPLSSCPPLSPLGPRPVERGASRSRPSGVGGGSRRVITPLAIGNTGGIPGNLLLAALRDLAVKVGDGVLIPEEDDSTGAATIVSTAATIPSGGPTLVYVHNRSALLLQICDEAAVGYSEA